MALITKLSTCVIGQNAVISTKGSLTSGTGRYSIEYEFGELTGVIVDNLPASGIPATITWTIPMAFAKEIPYASSKTGKLISYYTFLGKKDVNYTSTFTAKQPIMLYQQQIQLQQPQTLYHFDYRAILKLLLVVCPRSK